MSFGNKIFATWPRYNFLRIFFFGIPNCKGRFSTVFQLSIAMICVTKSRTGNYDFRARARARDFPGSTRFGRTHTLCRVCRAITR